VLGSNPSPGGKCLTKIFCSWIGLDVKRMSLEVLQRGAKVYNYYLCIEILSGTQEKTIVKVM
jgi:hypothetical protein